ncbi:putative gustatory receptor 36a [Drosophila miranda]|uniref:putative gustatory receptor 36a n=1 Tax=Drosophila miranda TaxID=7229 RepID=UPI00143F22A8|nr:putative gustatory receptor 36a [Drosophila miranda]
MVDWAGLVLKCSYYYGHLIGLTNFEFDWATGRVYTSQRSTVYAMCIGVMFPVLLAYRWVGRGKFNLMFENANMLHEYVMVLVRGLRIVAGLFTLIGRWQKRRHVMGLTRSVFRLFRERPEVLLMCRRGILIKVFIAVVTDSLHVLFSVDTMASHMDTGLLIGQFLMYSLTSIVNLAVAQHSLAMLFLRARYQLLNRELRQVIDESSGLSHRPPRRGVFICRCCCLADRLDAIASQQGRLQAMVVKIGQVFAIQGLLVYSGYYLSTVAVGYLTYSIVKNGPEALGITPMGLVLIAVWCCFYYTDALLNLFVILNILEEHRATTRLLEERTLFAEGLDVRLEQAFESLQLQLIRNPLELNIMQIFPVTRSSTTAMFGSVLTHCIFLIQYDMEHF